MWVRIERRHAIAIVVWAVLWTGCGGRDPGDPLKPGFNVYSPEQDIALGKQAAEQVRQQVDVVDNQTLQNYIDRVGKTLASQPPAGDYPYDFTLINDPSINAFALPGGPIFVHSGLIAEADNEAQVAGVLAHEIGHVALRHGTSQASKASLLQLPAALAGIMIGQESTLAQLGQAGVGLGLNALILRYSRDAETEADALATKIMAGAGYNPIEMARFFEKLEAEGGSNAPQFLSSHPNPGNRVEAVEAEIQILPAQPSYDAGTGQFKQAQQLVAKLPKPKRPVQQAAAAPQPPSGASGDFRQLRGNGFGIAYPANWEVFGNDNSDVVTIAPRQGLVRGQLGGIEVGYGAILSYYRPQGGRANLQQATQELISQLTQANPRMQISGGARSVQVSGQQGLVTQLSSPSPYGGAERDVLLTVARPEGLFYMVFIGPERGFNQLEPAFNQMVESIRFGS